MLFRSHDHHWPARPRHGPGVRRASRPSDTSQAPGACQDRAAGSSFSYRAPPVDPAASTVQPRLTCLRPGTCTGVRYRWRCALPGVQARALSIRHTWSCQAVVGRYRDRGLPSASACSPRCTRAAVAACPPLSKCPGLTVWRFSLIDSPGPESQLDLLMINVRLIYKSSRCGVWTITAFSLCTGRGPRPPR